MMPHPLESMDPHIGFRVLRIVHLAMSASVLVYGVVVYLLLTQGFIPEDGFGGDFAHLDIFRTLLWLMAGGHFMAIRFIKSRFLQIESLRQRALPVAQGINAVHIILFAIAEAIAIYGLLLFLIAALFEDFLVLAGFSLLILFWLRPKEDAYHALVRVAERT